MWNIFQDKSVVHYFRFLSSVLIQGSIVGIKGNAGQCVYSASKAGLVGFTKSLAKEVASRNIRVNCIIPGKCPSFFQDQGSQSPKSFTDNYGPSPGQLSNPIYGSVINDNISKCSITFNVCDRKGHLLEYLSKMFSPEWTVV